MSDLAERLAKVRAERAALAAAKAKADADRALEVELEAEELALKDDQAIAHAEAEHGPVGKKIATVHTDLGVIIVKRPNMTLFRRFQDTGSMKHADLDKLVRPCRVYPDEAAFDRILDELPATVARVASAVCELAGVRQQDTGGKS
jgi:hypothetical protein